MDHPFEEFLDALGQEIPNEQILRDDLSRHAYAHDASLYLIIPKAVVIVESEQEVLSVLQYARKYKIAITFRAAGTSLSGQAQTDSVLVVLGNHWRRYEILAQGLKIRLQPGIIGGEANLFLQPFKRKIGPDPASINAAKIGGIAANNSSGMCCGISQNSYHTLAGIRIIFADGTLLDTEDMASCQAFRASHHHWLQTLTEIRSIILQDTDLTDLICNQYRIKNTVGYNINAFLDHEDPIDILAHLMIGSEGTLGFIASITYNTVPADPFEAAALLFFDSIETACQASLNLPRDEIAAMELMDETSLIASKIEGKAALLIDIKAQSAEALADKTKKIKAKFITDRNEYNKIWAIRRGIIPVVAGNRTPGSALINEDVAVSPQDLPQFCTDLQALFKAHHYNKSCIFGHAKDGNLHFLLEENFATKTGIAQYDYFMQDLVKLVVNRYRGALKAEHGTGRNMAPFVEKAWGTKAYTIMQQIKKLLDSNAILNPDVILSQNINVHKEHLKLFPEVDPIIDRCIECGFCEKVCPSNKLTLTPRQRIVAMRDMKRLNEEFDDFEYAGLDTCAATGLCKTLCPVNINTGDMVRKRRFQAKREFQHKFITLWIKHFALVMKVMKWGSPLLRYRFRENNAKRDKSIHGRERLLMSSPNLSSLQPVYYFPSCSARTFNNEQQAVLEAILAKLGYRLETLKGSENQCCGLMFKSKGYLHEANQCAHRLEKFLSKKEIVLCEMGSCVLQMQHTFKDNIQVYEIIDFIADQLQNYPLKQQDKTIMLHITCSIARLGLRDKMIALAKRCVKNVVIPPDIHCCGFAGEKGFTTPELNQSALSTLKEQVPENCNEGYSMSITCEMGLSKAAGIPYQSLLYLIYEALH